jgi:hypothetical protein
LDVVALILLLLEEKVVAEYVSLVGTELETVLNTSVLRFSTDVELAMIDVVVSTSEPIPLG